LFFRLQDISAGLINVKPGQGGRQGTAKRNTGARIAFASATLVCAARKAGFDLNQKQ
jgi:hypothetical protein